MRLFIDCRMLFMSGIGRYIENILVNLTKVRTDIEYILAGPPETIAWLLERHSGLKRYVAGTIEFGASIYSVKEHVTGSWLLYLNRRTVNLFHFPHYSVPWFLPEKSVVTVHDLIHFRFSAHHGQLKTALARIVLRNAVLRAGRVIVVSHATRSDLVRKVPEARHKVRVIYEGVSETFSLAPEEKIRSFKEKHQLGRYILYVGNRKPHKNLERLLKAYQRLGNELPGLQLVICGKKFAPEDEVSLLRRELDLANVVELENVADEDLPCLYSGADVLVQPSLYEGFGLPPLEAMACGTPVVVSKMASLPEVVGDAGIYVDPYDVEDIVRGIYKALTDEGLRNHLREKGLARARVFTWEKAAEQTLAVYEEILREQRSNRL